MALHRLILFSLILAIITALSLVMPSDRQWINLPLHSTMEAVEALAVFLMALFLLQGREDPEHKLTLPGLGFLVMGILNIAHAASLPGGQFIHLRALANLAGGAGFALVWLPAARQTGLRKAGSVWSVAAGSGLFVLLAFLFPYSLPAMAVQGEFSAAAVAINAVAGLLFLAGTWRFLADFLRSGAVEDLLFGVVGGLFGLSGLTFWHSLLWSEAWWSWHGLRLAASLLVLGLLLRRHLQTVGALKELLHERSRSEDALRRSYKLTKTIIDSMNDAISLVDVKDFTIIGVNSVFLKEYGFSAESEVVGKHCYEITHKRSEVCTAPDDICPLGETVRTGDHFAADHVHFGTKGPKYVEVSTSPITDENGTVVQVVHVARDITDRKRAEQEREQLLADIARSNKELEQFAYVASHDLQEPLRMVSGFIGLLEKRYKGRLDEKADRYIRFAVDGALRMQKLIEGLLGYSRVTTRAGELKNVAVNSVFDEAVLNLSAMVRDSNAVVARDELPTVVGVETQLLQLLQNLLANAIKFKRPGVRPEIRVSSVRTGQEWTFSVRDNGIGIAKEHFERIFQIFQRLHSSDEYPGAGIGLAVCKKIVERHGGNIWAESVPGEGTTFFFTIAAKQAQAASDRAA